MYVHVRMCMHATHHAADDDRHEGHVAHAAHPITNRSKELHLTSPGLIHSVHQQEVGVITLECHRLNATGLGQAFVHVHLAVRNGAPTARHLGKRGEQIGGSYVYVYEYVHVHVHSPWQARRPRSEVDAQSRRRRGLQRT